MRKDSRVDESLNRVQLDLALKALYTSGDVPHSEEGGQEGVGAEVDVMDTVEPPHHAQVSLQTNRCQWVMYVTYAASVTSVATCIAIETRFPQCRGFSNSRNLVPWPG